MKIAFNPSTVAALTTPPNNKDITFDLRGRNIFARGVKFCGTDTNTWRDIKINNVSIGSNILDLRNGSNTTLTNTNGVVTVNSTWRPVVDNLTSDSTTSSLSAKQGKILKSLIDGKSDSGHTHDDRYLKLTGGWMSGDINFGGDNKIYWGRNTDSASISFKNDEDGDADSYMSFVTSDNSNEYFRWSHSSGSTNTEWMALRSDGLRVGGTKVSLEGHSHNDLYYTKTEVNNKLNGKSNSDHNHDSRYVKKSGDTMLGALNFANGTWNKIGDDVYMGDHNIGGQLCIMGANGTTGLSFHKYGDASIRKSITFDGNTLYMNGSCDYATLSNLTNLLAINTIPNKTTVTSIGSWSPISGRYVFHQKWTDTSTGSDSADFGIYLDGNLTANMVLDGYYNSLLGFRVIGATGGFLKANGTIDNNTYLTSHLSLSNYYTKSEVDNQLSKYKLKSSIWVPEAKIVCSNFRDFLNKENLHKLAPEELNLYRFFAAGDESNYSSKYNYPVVDSHAMVFSIDGNNGYIRSMNFDLRSNDVYVTSRVANGEWRSWVRLLNTSDVAGLKNDLTVHLYLSNTDTTWWPLIWGGSSHNNTSDSTGEVYKSYDKLSWLTSSLTLYATNIQTENIKHLSIGGGIYWNPYVESASDGSDAASITLVKLGVAGGTTLVLSLMNDANDTILFQTNDAARLYHNNNFVLTSKDTKVTSGKGYINNTEITQVNNSINADMIDNVHLESILTYKNIIGNQIQNNHDFHSVLKLGVYSMIWGGYIANHPSDWEDGSNHYGSMLHFGNANDNHGYILLDRATNNMYFKNINSATSYGLWYKVAHSGNSSISGSTITINGNSLTVSKSDHNHDGRYLKWLGNAGQSNMNAIGRISHSSGMTNLSDPRNTIDNPMEGGSKSTSWHLYWLTNYTDDPSGSNAWVALIVNRAGTDRWWVRSRSGGTITNGANWTSNWRFLVTAPTSGLGGSSLPVYINSAGEVVAANSYPTSLKNPHLLTLKANGTTLATYDGSSAKEVNFTYTNIGAASASHTHDDRYIRKWTGVYGSANKFLKLVISDEKGWIRLEVSDSNNALSGGYGIYIIGWGYHGNNGTDTLFARCLYANDSRYTTALKIVRTSRNNYDFYFLFASGSSYPSYTINYSSSVSSIDCTVTAIDTIPTATWTSSLSALQLNASQVDWSGITNKPSVFNPAAHTHTVFKNNLMIKGTNGVSDSSSIHLGIGDSDTGFKWISDGKCLIYANNSAVGEWTSGGMNWFKNPTVNGNKVWNAGNDGSGSGLDADTVDGYHASSLWRSDGGIWNPGANISLNASGNNQEWSFDIKRNGYTGCYWHVWDSALNSMLKVNADNGKVYAPYNFVGNLEGNASSATALTTNAGNSINPVYFSGGKPIACTMSTGRGNGIVRSFSRGTYKSANLYFGNGTIVAIDPIGTGCISANDTILSLGDLAERNTQLLVAYDRDGVYYRRITDNLNYGNWKRLAFTTDNVASASKLATARSIWGHSFNGTADVNGTIYINNSNSSEGAIRLNNNINSNARISAIDSQVIFNTDAAIRFGGTSWDWNVWAGLKYTHSNKTIYLGIADNSIFNANSALSGGSLRFPGISNVYATTFNGSLSGNASTATNADTVDGEHASAFTRIVGRNSIGTSGTAPYNYIHLFRIANSSGYSTVDCEIDFRTRYHSAKLEIRISTAQYPYNSGGSSISIVKKIISGRSCKFWILRTVQSSNYNYYDVYYESGAWNSGSYGIIFKGSNGGLVFEHKGTNLASLPDKVVPVTDDVAASATKVIVNLHTANDTNYPLVWSNLNNSNTVTENQLYKSWSDLYYNPKSKRLTVGGSIYAAHFYESSDKTLKKNIKSILSSTNIPKIREFDWKDTEEHSYGFIALELEELGYGCLVSEVNGKKTVNYTATLALTVAKLLNLINIQNKKISNLTKELKALKYGRKKNS